MYSVVQFVHSYWAYLVLIVIVVATFNAIAKFFGKKEYGGRDMSLALFTLIVMHIQLLIGLLLWFISPNGLSAIQANGMGGLTRASRQLAVEHPTLMIVAVVLVTIGYSKHKKQRLSTPKFKKIAIFYTLALLALLAVIPWAQWF